MKLSDKQIEVLENGCGGICYHYQWKWVKNGESYSAAVNGLMKRGLASAMYFTGGRASVNATDAGRTLLASRS